MLVIARDQIPIDWDIQVIQKVLAITVSARWDRNTARF